MRKMRFLAGIMVCILLMGIIGGACAEWKEEKKGGKVVRRSWADENGAAAMSPEGYAVVTLSYSGTTVTERYYDLAGNPAEAIGGYYGRQMTYGNKHRLEDLIYLDQYGTKTACDAGYARLRITYMSTGDVKEAIYYDEDNKIVFVPSLGYAQVASEYRGKILTKTTYMDEKGKPVDTPLGYAVLIQGVNKSNKLLSIRFEHADGTAAVCLEGWATMRREIDSKSREVSRKYYDLAGNLLDRGLGYAYESKKWESDLICVVRRYDVNDQQIPMGDGYMAVRRQMNKAGQVIRETYLDATGNMVENAEGIASKKYEYDSAGSLAKVTYEDASGKAQK